MSEQTNGLNFDVPKHNHRGAVAKEYESRFRILERLNRDWHSGICLKGVDEEKIKQYYPSNNAAAHILAVNDFLRINRAVIDAAPLNAVSGRITHAAVDCASISQEIKDGANVGSVNQMIKDGKPTAIALDFSYPVTGSDEYMSGFRYRMNMIARSNKKWSPGDYVFDCNPQLFVSHNGSDVIVGQLDAIKHFISVNSAALKLNDKNAAQCFTELAGWKPYSVACSSEGFASRCVMVETKPETKTAIKVPAMQWLVVRTDRKNKTAAFVAAFFDKGAAVQYALDQHGGDFFSFGVTTADDTDKYLSGFKMEH